MTAIAAPERATPPGLAGTGGGQTAPSGHAMPRASVRNITRRRQLSEAWSAREIARRMVARHGRAGGRLLAIEQRDAHVRYVDGRRRVKHPQRWLLWHIVQELCGWQRLRRGQA